MKKIRFGILVFGTLFLGLGCTSRNLHKHDRQSDVLERGMVYQSRTEILDAGAEPVEFGSPVVTRDTIYVSTETQGLEAYERSSFRRKWQFKVKNGLSSEPLLRDGTLYFGANDGNFYALDAEFGRTLWKYETKAPVFARATVANGKVLISASDDIVYCLEQGSGKWVWHYKRGGNYITTVNGNSTPAVEGTQVYAGFSDGYLVALNAKDGNLLWEQRIHKGTKFTDVDAMPLVVDDKIYVPSYDGELYALERTKGKVLWHIDVGGSKKVLVDDKTLFLGSSNGSVYSINRDTGRILWKFDLDEGTPTNLVQHENYLAFGSSRIYFYAIHKGNGTLAYRYNVGHRSGFVSNPTQANDEIFILSNYGNLYSFRWKVAKKL